MSHVEALVSTSPEGILGQQRRLTPAVTVGIAPTPHGGRRKGPLGSAAHGLSVEKGSLWGQWTLSVT